MAYPLRDRAERLITAAEFAKLPEDDRYTFELVRGRVVRSPRPATFHGLLVIRLGHALHEFVEAGGHGVVVAEGGALLERDPDTVRGPDVAFYSRERVPKNAYGTTFWGPPDLAAEITSPSNRRAEIKAKLTDYLDNDVRLVWVVDPPTRSVTVHSRPGGAARLVTSPDTLDGAEVLPGFRLPLAPFFVL